MSCQSDADTPLDKRVSTVGRVQPHLEVKIVDPETGAIVPRGERGELCTRATPSCTATGATLEKTREAIDAEALDAHRRPGHHGRARAM